MPAKIKQQQTIAEKFAKQGILIQLCISIAIFVLVIFIGYYFDTTSQQKILQRLERDHARLANELSAKQQLLAKQTITKHKLALMEQYIKQDKMQSSGEYDQGMIIEQLHDLGAKQQIQFRFIKPLKTQYRSYYSKLPIDIAATGEYHRIALFLSAISNLKLPIVVTDFVIKHDDKASDMVSLRLIGQIYSLDPKQVEVKYYPIALNPAVNEQPLLPKPAATMHYTQQNLRDPFHRIDATKTKQYSNVILRAVPLSKIELVGTITEGTKQWAIIMPISENSDRITTKVTIGDRISQSQALIRGITDDQVILEKEIDGDDSSKTETVTLTVNEGA